MQVKTVYHCIPCSEPSFSRRDRQTGKMVKADAAVFTVCRSSLELFSHCANGRASTVMSDSFVIIQISFYLRQQLQKVVYFYQCTISL